MWYTYNYYVEGRRRSCRVDYRLFGIRMRYYSGTTALSVARGYNIIIRRDTMFCERKLGG